MRETSFFDFSSFTRQQIDHLENEEPRVRKKTAVDDSVAVNTDTVDWTQELQVLIEEDISSPGIAESYDLHTRTEENSRVEVYSLKENYNEPVRKARVTYQNDQVENIYLLITRNTYILDSQKEVSFTFKQNSQAASQPVLSSYLVNGWNKLLLQDTMYFQVEASVIR